MAGADYRLRIWGARGTIPSPSPKKVRFGGNTPSLSLTISEREHLILDCGSGIRMFGASLPRNAERLPRRFHIFLSHYHFDHVEGLPLFQPLYSAENEIVIHGMNACGMDAKTILESLIHPPYFPVTLADVPSNVRFVDAGVTPITIGDITIHSQPLNHPDGCLSFRLARGGRTIVYATDHEHGDTATDLALVEFARNADHLIYDATYQPAEYEEMRKGWGHSTWYAAVRTAISAGVKNLLLFHHHPDHSDEELERVVEVARQEFPNTSIAREGLELLL